MEALEQALKIAILALDGQRDKDGQPEMLNNVMVGFAGQNEDELLTGLLLGVIKGRREAATFMEITGIPSHVVDALEVLEDKKGKSMEEYMHSILQSGNDLAVKVKMNELRYRIKRDKLADHQKQLEKDEKALSILTKGE